jgi:hypothetical protein
MVQISRLLPERQQIADQPGVRRGRLARRLGLAGQHHREHGQNGETDHHGQPQA